MEITKIEPCNWFVGTKSTELQLLVYGKGMNSASIDVGIPYSNIDVSQTDDGKYILLKLKLGASLKEGKYTLGFHKGENSINIEYEFRQKKEWLHQSSTISNDDAIYMLMPDRFAKDYRSECCQDGINEKNPNIWHGGNIAGITKALRYVSWLGFTSVWHTPIFKCSDYHGYSIEDFYNVDSHFGNLDDYKIFVELAHSKGIKVVMDIILNHCSINHPWMEVAPQKNWINGARDSFEKTNYKLTTVFDGYASEIDERQTVKGWFTEQMPDINMQNEDVRQYFFQVAVWWIETFRIDAFRVDTYSYVDMESMIKWQNMLNEEYPFFSIVAETWVPEPAFTAHLQNVVCKKLNKECSFIVMDFAYQKKIEQYLNRKAEYDKESLMYYHFVYDFLYESANNTLAFLDNHDLPRWFEHIRSKAKLKQALAILLTSPRIPQIYSGTELMLSGKGKGDGERREDTFEQMNSWEKLKNTDVVSYLHKLLWFRKDSNAIRKGTMKHFIPQNGVYVYFRQYQDEKIMVLSNATSHVCYLPLSQYSEELSGYRFGVDVMTGIKRSFDDNEIEINKNSVLILKIQKYV